MLLDRAHRVHHCLFGALPRPDERGEDDEREERDPHYRRASEAMLCVVLEHHTVKQKAEDAPRGEYEIALSRERSNREHIRNEEIQGENTARGKSRAREHHNRCIFLLARQLQSAA